MVMINIKFKFFNIAYNKIVIVTCLINLKCFYIRLKYIMNYIKIKLCILCKYTSIATMCVFHIIYFILNNILVF